MAKRKVKPQYVRVLGGVTETFTAGSPEGGPLAIVQKLSRKQAVALFRALAEYLGYEIQE